MVTVEETDTDVFVGEDILFLLMVEAGINAVGHGDSYVVSRVITEPNVRVIFDKIVCSFSLAELATLIRCRLHIEPLYLYKYYCVRFNRILGDEFALGYTPRTVYVTRRDHIRAALMSRSLLFLADGSLMFEPTLDRALCTLSDSREHSTTFQVFQDVLKFSGMVWNFEEHLGTIWNVVEYSQIFTKALDYCRNLEKTKFSALTDVRGAFSEIRRCAL
ncbi:hypothetical protein EVAR_86612_1 [Eumeta japonica]|uniref:Uncharacterized protein n=1 Tax=Eumeta variegata TaxID=151549 RepID=A0A4C1W3Z5_EUMVA|nr:hypothetical protein EVAR_86612_1 [Eumeta japonica]